MDLLSVVLLLGAALGWGALLMPCGLVDRESRFLALAIGFAALSHVTAFLGAVGLLRPAPILLTVYGGAAAGAARWLASRRRRAAGSPDPAGGVPRWAAALALVLSSLTVWRALERDRGPDPYHAVLPKAFLLQGRLTPFPGVVESTYPMGWEMLNVAAFAHGTGGQPALLSALALVLAAWGVAIALEKEGRAAAALGCLLVLTNPLLLRTAATSHIECGQAFLVVASLVAALRFRREGSAWSLLCACALLGTLASTKETAAATLVLPGIVVLLAPGRRSPGPRARWVVATAVALVLLLPAPWLARKVSATRNPLYPLASGFFQTEAVFLPGAEAFRARHEGAGQVSLRRVADLVPALSVDGTGEAAFGALALALLLWRRARARWGPVLAGAAAAFAATCATPPGQTRFLAPSVPFFVLAGASLLAFVFEAVRTRLPGLAALAGAAVVANLIVRVPLHVLPLYPDAGDLLRLPPVTLEGRRARALEGDAEAAVLATVNEVLGRGEKVLVVSAPRHLEFLDVPFLPPSHFQHDLRSTLRASGLWRREGHLGVTAELVFADGDAESERTASRPALLDAGGVRLLRAAGPALRPRRRRRAAG